MPDMKLWQGDCLELMKQIPDGSIDLILTDPPYGTTKCRWDTVIPFEPMWAELKRIIKYNGAICLFGSEPFSSALRMSNLKWFKYDWIWRKSKAVGYVNAKLKPMNKHEIISIFSEGTTANCSSRNMLYFPQGLIEVNWNKKAKTKSKNGENDYFRKSMNKHGYKQKFTNYPTTVINFNSEGKPVHPTQKPTKLLEYLIKTYTLENETVLDFTMGSGSTGVACKNLNRNFIGIELDEKYFKIACERIDNA